MRIFGQHAEDVTRGHNRLPAPEPSRRRGAARPLGGVGRMRRAVRAAPGRAGSRRRHPVRRAAGCSAAARDTARATMDGRISANGGVTEIEDIDTQDLLGSWTRSRRRSSKGRRSSPAYASFTASPTVVHPSRNPVLAPRAARTGFECPKEARIEFLHLGASRVACTFRSTIARLGPRGPCTFRLITTHIGTSLVRKPAERLGSDPAGCRIFSSTRTGAILVGA